MTRLAALSLIVALCPAGAGAHQTIDPDWRRLATASDRTRLRQWRSAWGEALAMARRDRAGMVAIAGDPVLFDPDRTMTGAMPPVGDYDCRIVKLGHVGNNRQAYTAQDWSRCRIDPAPDHDGPGLFHLTALDGRQRPIGLLYPDTDARSVFLGALTLADERPLDYGRDQGRDMIGLMERIGADRWRLVLPHPAYQSVLDLLELRPAGQRGGSAGSVAR
jgi:hypothetical protein